MYVKKTYVYGNRIEVRKYHTYKCGVKGEKRSKRKKPTPEQMQDANERRAKRKLSRLMIGNFVCGDWHMVLTYAQDRRPDVDGSKRCLALFLKRMRKLYKKAGIELKWIAVTEWEKTNIHHHLAINDVPGMAAAVRQCWTWGNAHLTPLYADGDYEGLAEYFVKETSLSFRKETNAYKQRWSCSRNLVRPQVETEIIKANSWRKQPKLTKEQEEKGYQLLKDSLYVGVDACGYPFQEYMLIRYGRSGEKEKKRFMHKTCGI